MANQIASALQLDVIMTYALTAFQEQLQSLSLFSTAFRDVPLNGTDKMQVPFYPLATSTSKDFNGSYVFTDGTSVESREIAINKRKYQTISYTSEELNRQPALSPERFGQLKGQKLAEDVVADILSVVLAANFGSTALSEGNFGAANVITAAYSAFDMDNVIDLEAMADAHKWPRTQRGLILPPSYLGNMKKDIKDTGGIATFGINPTGETNTLPMLNSFSLASSNIIPANGENLVGMAVHPSAILIGFSPIAPTPEVRAALIDYQAYTDPQTNLTIEMRKWGDPDSDTTKVTMEVNYGYAKGNADALFRIKSA